jgi:two-component system cell cycle response regulator
MSRSILIIEDSPTTRSVVKIYLSGHNLEFHEAADGEQGLELARRLVPSAIICDLKLPGADGFTICRKLRSDPKLRHIPIILLTGSKGDALQKEALKAGATHFMTKPIDAEALAKRILACIRPAR